MAQVGEEHVADRARAEALVTMVATRWSASLLRCARRWSRDDEDAQDAYQRMMEQLVRWAPRLDPERVCGWAHTVVKREALALREARSRRVEAEEEDVAGPSPTPEEHAVDLDDLERAAEALAGLKPQEVRALWLQAQGLSYKEICAATDWSYTKVRWRFGYLSLRAPCTAGIAEADA
jgi:RNA polymerase sigma factor (sigma-70 family)